jgi:predicted amidohydrolase
MKIGFMQCTPVLGDVQATIDKIEALVPHCADADLVVLPELCNSGYNFVSRDQAWATSEPIGGGPFLDYLAGLCRQFGFHLVSGLNERDGERLYNSAALVGPGGYVGRYRKLHLFWNEVDFFEPGDAGLPVFDIGPCRLGMLVCFDWIYPEAWRVLALQGADLICHPSNLVLPGLAQSAVPIRALTNRLYVVTANRVGSEGDLTFTGLSTIAAPTGEVLLQASATAETVGLVEVDIGLARDKQITPRNHLFAGRRPEAYRLLTAPTAPPHR